MMLLRLECGRVLNLGAAKSFAAAVYEDGEPCLCVEWPDGEEEVLDGPDLMAATRMLAASLAEAATFVDEVFDPVVPASPLELCGALRVGKN